MSKETRKLSVKLTEGEKIECARQAARLVRRYDALEEEKSRVVKDLGKQMKETKRAISMKSAAHETGVEERMVECTQTVHGMQLVVTRDDTHEVVEERTLSEEELEAIDATPETSAEPPKRARVKKPEPAPPSSLN